MFCAFHGNIVEEPLLSDSQYFRGHRQIHSGELTQIERQSVIDVFCVSLFLTRYADKKIFCSMLKPIRSPMPNYFDGCCFFLHQQKIIRMILGDLAHTLWLYLSHP